MLKKLKSSIQNQPNKNLRASLNPMFTPQKQKNTQHVSFFPSKKKTVSDLGHSLGAFYGLRFTKLISHPLLSICQHLVERCVVASRHSSSAAVLDLGVVKLFFFR